MDVRTNNFQVYGGQAGMSTLRPASGNAAEEAVSSTGSEAIRPEFKVMMDLSEMKNFLYMMIGSTIKLESESDQTGSRFNSVA